MCFSAIAVGLVAAAQGAVLEARDTECTVYLEPTVDEPRGAGELITLGSIDRWVDATGAWVDYSGSLADPYSFKCKANVIPGYEIGAKIEAVLSNGWVGTYLVGVDTPYEYADFLITAYSCN